MTPFLAEYSLMVNLIENEFPEMNFDIDCLIESTFCVACKAWSTDRDLRRRWHPRCHTFGFGWITFEGIHQFHSNFTEG